MSILAQFVGSEEAENTIGVKCGEVARGGRPMGGEPGGLVDDEMGEFVGRKDCDGALATPAGIEIVAVEVESHHPGVAHMPDGQDGMPSWPLALVRVAKLETWVVTRSCPQEGHSTPSASALRRTEASPWAWTAW